MKSKKKDTPNPTPSSTIKEIDNLLKFRYYVDIDGRPQDKEYFEDILNDIEKLVSQVICQTCQGSGVVQDGGIFSQFYKCDCCDEGIKI
jgi:hypothetical protein